MKKLLFALTAIALSIGVKAQSKIGNVTVADSVFSRYIFDCYKHPDKLYYQGWKFSEPVDGFSTLNREQEIKDDLYNAILDKNKIRDFYEFYNHDHKTKHIAGCYVPRKPTEQDFIKWYTKTYSK